MSWKQHLTNLVGMVWQKKAEVVAIPELEEIAIPEPKKVVLSRPGKKLNEEHQALVCKMLGYGFTAKEIAEELKESHGIEINRRSIQAYKNNENYDAAIKRYRDEYVSLYHDVPGFHKKIRLVRMEKVIEKAEEEGDLKRIIEATEHQRKEIEGSGDINISLVSNRYYTMSDEELAKREELIHIMKAEGRDINAEKRDEKQTGSGEGQSSGKEDI